MSEQNIFDMFFVSQYGTLAKNIEELAKNFEVEYVFQAMMKAKRTELTNDLKYHTYMDWDDFNSYERTKMFLIIPELQEIYTNDDNVTDEEIGELFFSQEKQTFLFAPHYASEIALFIQKEIDPNKLDQIKEVCNKANMEVVYEKYDVSNYI